MLSRDRDLLRKALANSLPAGFSFEEWDSFINYTPPGRVLRSCRVIRLVGPGRMLVLFDYVGLVRSDGWPGRAYRMRYLDEQNDLVEFDPKSLTANMTAPYSWEKVVGNWLEAHGARQFRGHGWAAECSMKVINLCTRWTRHYSGLQSSD